MNKLLTLGFGLAALAATDVLSAHGGRYPGPTDIVPPGTKPKSGSPGNPGPLTPGPTAPGAPRPAGPVTPGPRAPSPPPTGGPNPPGVGGGPFTRGGSSLGVDLSMWQFWWEFNKDRFINLKEAIHAPMAISGSDEIFLGPSRRVESKNTAKPSDSDIEDTILPALHRALETTDNRDINSSCVVAMAKIGRNSRTFKILPLLARNLKKRDQEIRETAALAMGISAMPEALDDLIGLATDDAHGRRLTERSQVDARTRSFACYGIGLLAYANAGLALKTRAFAALDRVLHDDSAGDRNITIAAINGISLLKIPTGNAGAGERKLLEDALASLDRYYDKKLGKGSDVMKAHVPPAIAKLIGRGNSDLHRQYKDRFLANLLPKRRHGNELYQSAALALGRTALPEEIEKGDGRYSAGLRKYFADGSDAQARFFSLLALGQIGGSGNRQALMTVLARGNKALDQPWAAIALGVMSFETHRNHKDAGVDDSVGRLLLKQLKSVKNPDSRAAFAVALGLTRYRDAAGEMMNMLTKYRAQSELAGYLCIGLALMDCQRARVDIHELVKSSVRRPDLLKQAAIALGKLGDREATTTLTGKLQEDDANLAKLSAIASALAFIGDRRTIQPLKKMLFDETLTPLSRAFAAVALGGIAAREKLPWTSKLSRDMNYRAAVETLTQSGTGVLDIL